MPAVRYFSPMNTLEQKLQIERRLGKVKACKYFNLLTRFLTLKISKHEFDRLCIATIGSDNVPLHNHFIRSILKKACLSKTALSRESKVEGSWNVNLTNGCNNLQFLCKDFLQSPRKGRTPTLRDSKVRNCNPLGPHGKRNSVGFEESAPKIHEQQRNNIDLLSVGTRFLLSMEDEEEVDEDFERLSIHNSPMLAPLAIPTYIKKARKISCKELPSVSVTDTCQSTGQLPDTPSLIKRLEQKLEREGYKISDDAANLLNKALDVYLKRLIKPCLHLAASKTVNKSNGPLQPGLNELPRNSCEQRLIGSVSASISDFRAVVDLNPIMLGEDWSLHLEKVCLHACEE